MTAAPAETTARPQIRRLDHLPDEIRSIITLDPVDYFDVFTVTAPVIREASSLEWGRAILDDAGGALAQIVWRGLLRLQLGPRDAADRIAGWSIAARGDDWNRIETSSRELTVQLVARVDGDTLTTGTFLRYDRPLARFLWRPISVVHLRTVPRLIREAMRSKRRTVSR